MSTNRTTDPDEAPEAHTLQRSSISFGVLAALPFGKLLDVARETDSVYFTDDTYRDVFRKLHAVDPMAAVKLLDADVTGRRLASDSARLEMYGEYGGPLDIALVQQVAASEGVELDAAASLVSGDRDIAELRERLGPKQNDLEWLDTTRLATPATPWSDDDYQRDRRRAQAAELPELTRERWALSAEQGSDAVADQIDARLASEIDDVLRLRHTTSVVEKQRADRAAQDERAKAKAKKQKDSGPAFSTRSGEVATMGDGTPARW